MTVYPYQCCPYLVAVAKLAGYTHLRIVHYDDGPEAEQWQIHVRWRLDAENPLMRGDELYRLSTAGTFGEAYRQAFERLGIEPPGRIPILYTVEELSVNQMEERQQNDGAVGKAPDGESSSRRASLVVFD